MSVLLLLRAKRDSKQKKKKTKRVQPRYTKTVFNDTNSRKYIFVGNKQKYIFREFTRRVVEFLS